MAAKAKITKDIALIWSLEHCNCNGTVRQRQSRITT